MIQLFNLILVEPLLNVLIFFYNTIAFQDFGLAIIFLTILLRLILYPLSVSQIKSQKSLTALQGKIEEIKKKYKDNKQEQAKATMELYRLNKVNPFSSCFSSLIQLPILFAVFQVFRTGLGNDGLSLYSFIANPGELNTVAFGFIELAEKSFPLALITAIVQYFQSKMLSSKKPPATVAKDKGARDESMMATMNKKMLIILPVFTVIIGMTLPAGLVFYWLISTALILLQQAIMFKKSNLKKINPVNTSVVDKNNSVE